MSVFMVFGQFFLEPASKIFLLKFCILLGHHLGENVTAEFSKNYRPKMGHINVNIGWKTCMLCSWNLLYEFPEILQDNGTLELSEAEISEYLEITY